MNHHDEGIIYNACINGIKEQKKNFHEYRKILR